MKRVSTLRVIVLLIVTVLSGTVCSKIFDGPTPSVQAVTPTRGWTGIDTPITITGSGFAPMVKNTLSGTRSVILPSVTLQSSPTTVLQVSFAGTTQIHAVVPSGAPVGGPYTLTVTNPNGKSGSEASAYTVTETPLIGVTSIYPNFGWTGGTTTVYISGDNFTSTPAAYLITPTTGRANQLDNIAFINSQSLSAIVPAGLTPANGYTLTVINPDGNVGILPDAFTVTSLPPPYVASVDPGQATTNSGVTVTITGSNFRQPSIDLIDSEGQAIPCTISLTFTSATTLTATVPAACLGAAGVYLVRVTDQDEGSFYDWSAFVVTNPASNPGFWKPSPATSWLTKGRTGLGVTSGRNDVKQIFLYAIGGAGTFTPPTTATKIYNDSEVVQLDPFGRLGSWNPIPNLMHAPRFGLAAVQFSGWVYAIGGTADGTNPVSMCPVERAAILPSADAPQNLRLTSSGGGTLSSGTWYYRVSAVLDSSAPDNPSGETLPSDERVITVLGGRSVGLTWSPPSQDSSHILYYRVYRTDAPNGVSGTEHLIADTVTSTSFTDNGLSSGTSPFLPNGSLGTFTCTGTGFTPRYGLSAVVGHDSAGAYYIYALGGSLAGGTATGVVEYSLINSTTGSLGTWNTAAADITPRYFLASAFADIANAPIVGANNFIYAIGGTFNGGSSLGDVQLGSISAGGNITSWTTETALNPSNRGLACVAADDWIFDIDGWQGGGPGNKVDSSEILSSTGNNGNWNSAGNGGTTLWSRFLGGVTLESAYIYLIGGYGSCSSPQCTTPTTDTALQTVEEVIW